jgi:hypothetical protein
VMGSAATAAPFVAGGAAALVTVATGGYQIYSAGKQKAELSHKMQVLGHASSNERIGSDVAKLKAAADDIKASREKHISHTKQLGIANVGWGVAALALLGVALVVSAPVLLPILSLASLAVGVGVGVASLVRGFEKKRSEDKINTLIDASVQAQGALSETDIKGLVGDKKFRKTANRDETRVGKINEGVAALNTMLQKLSTLDRHANAEQHAEIVAFLTDAKFGDGPQRKVIKDKLNGLTAENFAESRGPLLAMLSKQVLV